MSVQKDATMKFSRKEAGGDASDWSTQVAPCYHALTLGSAGLPLEITCQCMYVARVFAHKDTPHFDRDT